MIGKAFVAHVNERSSNHDPNHVLNHIPKRLSERDSSPCKHTHCLKLYQMECYSQNFMPVDFHIEELCNPCNYFNNLGEIS